MRNCCIQIALSAALLMGTAFAQAAPPHQAQITYDLRDDGASVAQVVDRFGYGDGKYLITEHWKGRGLYALLGSVTRISRGSVGPEGLRPLEYSDARTGRATARAVFDWQTHTLTLQRGGAPQTRSLPSGTQDKLSLAFDFAFHPPGARPVTVHATDGNGLTTYVFRAAGRHKLKTPAGVFETLRLVKQRDGPGDSGTEIWLAAEHGYLPVRILVTKKNGTRYDQIATELSGR